MTFRMSAEAQTIRVFNLLDGTNEFIGESDAYIPPYTGLPANCTDVEPPTVPAGYAAVFDFSTECWQIIEDHRGKTVYSVETGSPILITELGAIQQNVTSIPPDGEYQKWDGSAWVTDESAKHDALLQNAENEKLQLMQEAAKQMAPLQDAVDLDIATDDEIALLNKWKKYRVLLNRVDTSLAPDITWPEMPV